MIRQKAVVSAGKAFEASNSNLTSTGPDFIDSDCLEQSITIRGAFSLKFLSESSGSVGYLPG